MTEFFTERSIKKTKKDHQCLGCNKNISQGSPANYYAAKDDGQFFDAYYHTDCRDAEIEWNDLHNTWGYEYTPLYMMDDQDDYDWIKDKYPVVASRMGVV